MIRHGQIETEQPKDRADQPLGLAQRQPEHRPQRQGRPDRQSRIVGLTATCGAGLRPPGRNRFLREPDGETSPLTQSWRRTPPSSSPGAAASGCGDGERHWP